MQYIMLTSARGSLESVFEREMFIKTFSELQESERRRILLFIQMIIRT